MKTKKKWMDYKKRTKYNNLMEQIAPDDRDNFDEDPTLIPAKM